MKKTITTILTLSALAFYAQDAAKVKGVSNMKDKLALRHQLLLNKDKSAAAKASVTQQPATAAQKSTASVTSFTSFSSSANIYGVVLNTLKPLQYNDNVNAVSFIQRKSSTYTGVPNNNTGVIVAMVSTNWGGHWDSTAIYSDANNFGRYPQGAIYSAPGNTNIANAYVVGSGECTDGSSFTGSWFASKQLGVASSTVYNNVASSTPGAQQFYSTNGPFGPTVFSNDWACYGFTSSDNGKVKALAELTFDPDAAPIEARGAVIQTGVFNAGVFNWSTDSILPSVVLQSSGVRQMNPNAVMAWNEAGTTGYVVFIGSKTGQTLSNKGWQPIVYKTTNSGTTWASIQGIDFNTAAFQPLKNHLDAVPTNASLKIPFFNPFEGIDCTVDNNDKLHIVAAIASTGSEATDSLAFTNEYSSELYVWPHTPGKQAYMYDFIGDGSGPWTYLTIDSITSEAPGAVSGTAGFSDNPWDDDAGKVTSDSRIQISRTPDGKCIVYTWAESDPNFTNGQKNWNNIPNVKARMWSNDPSLPVALSQTELNLTKPSPSSIIPQVSNSAFFHFASPTCGVQTISGTGTSTVQVKMPLTVSSSAPTLVQGSPNTHYYSTETMNFVFAPVLGVHENKQNAAQFLLYPNPASQNCLVAMDLLEPADLEVLVLNYLGQVVKQRTVKAQFGRNEMEVDLTNVKAGIYFVSVKNGNMTSTKKLVVE